MTDDARAGEVGIRIMTAADLPAADRLRAQVGFNQRLEDWRNLLGWEPSGCYVAESAEGEVIGTATTTRYGSALAWIGMLLVDKEHRRRAIGSSLLTTALAGLDDVTSVALDATPAGRALYQRHGFVDRGYLSRWQGVVSPSHVGAAGRAPRSVEVAPMVLADAGEVMELDRLACGVDRTRVLTQLSMSSNQSCWIARRGGRLVGFALTRPGSTHQVIGPLTAVDREAAQELLDSVLDSFASRLVVTDVVDGSELAPVLTGRGLAYARPLIRMSRAPLPTGRAELCHAIAGPEIG
jgi:ribosomal protein S18 acetylase RimI-like enzyme